jgi:hypothetical protein
MRARTLGSMLVVSVAAAGALALVQLAFAQTAAPSSECRTCGRVVAIRTSATVDRWEPLGSAVGGGVADVGGLGGSTQPTAVTSYRIGKGGKNEGMVLLGSAGGANYKKSSASYERKGWEVTVQLDNGDTRTVALRYEPYVREGDRVRIAGNNLEPVD